ncbi:hypothetical protein SAMN05216276_102817 [Streptosporangium subroseum]|uniref:Uncharacterized protein n=1 Tax=Streptosporangium subroseum TaxID=106412 RepID=A0A239KPR9_9ACTN|nr:hypothetical protein SAMN05216276_102817 [Streptosporangium subroseum]
MDPISKRHLQVCCGQITVQPGVGGSGLIFGPAIVLPAGC